MEGLDVPLALRRTAERHEMSQRRPERHPLAGAHARCRHCCITSIPSSSRTRSRRPTAASGTRSTCRASPGSSFSMPPPSGCPSSSQLSRPAGEFHAAESPCSEMPPSSNRPDRRSRARIAAGARAPAAIRGQRWRLSAHVRQDERGTPHVGNRVPRGPVATLVRGPRPLAFGGVQIRPDRAGHLGARRDAQEQYRFVLRHPALDVGVVDNRTGEVPAVPDRRHEELVGYREALHVRRTQMEEAIGAADITDADLRDLSQADRVGLGRHALVEVPNTRRQQERPQPAAPSDTPSLHGDVLRHRRRRRTGVESLDSRQPDGACAGARAVGQQQPAVFRQPREDLVLDGDQLHGTEVGDQVVHERTGVRCVTDLGRHDEGHPPARTQLAARRDDERRP